MNLVKIGTKKNNKTVKIMSSDIWKNILSYMYNIKYDIITIAMGLFIK